MVWMYAVDVPYLDEWDNLPLNSSWQWLFHQHNEHRLFTTEVFVCALYHLDHWNVATHQVINFAIYGGLLVVIGYFVKYVNPQVGWGVLSSFFDFPFIADYLRKSHDGIAVQRAFYATVFSCRRLLLV